MEELDFAARLRMERARMRITREQLADGISVPASTIKGWENNRVPAADLAVHLARYFGRTVEWFFTGETEKQDKIADPRIKSLCDKAKKLPASRIDDLITMAEAWGAGLPERESRVG